MNISVGTYISGGYVTNSCSNAVPFLNNMNAPVVVCSGSQKIYTQGAIIQHFSKKKTHWFGSLVPKIKFFYKRFFNHLLLEPVLQKEKRPWWDD